MFDEDEGEEIVFKTWIILTIGGCTEETTILDVILGGKLWET